MHLWLGVLGGILCEQLSLHAVKKATRVRATRNPHCISHITKWPEWFYFGEKVLFVNICSLGTKNMKNLILNSIPG